MKLPLISRKRHDAEIVALKRSISNICNTGCRTARCSGNKIDSLEKKSGSTKGHTFAPPGKRVLVTKHNGEQFLAKFKEKTGKFHIFHDHERVRSASIKSLSIVTTDFKEPS